MSLFDMCCPKKPKKSLDYVIKWIDGVDSMLKEINTTLENIQTWRSDVESWMDNMQSWKDTVGQDIPRQAKEAVDDVVNNYDWSVLPEEALNAKADKVQEATEGNFASLDSYGNLLDSGYKASSFAQTEHYHRSLRLASSLYPTEYNYISLDEIEQQGRIYISLYDAETGDSAFSDYVTADKLNNTFYPVTNPIANSTKLITSGGVERALKNKTSISHEDMDSIVEVEVKHIGDDEYDQAKVIGKNRIVLGVGTNAEDGSVIVDANNITNLQRALQTHDTTPIANSNNLVTSGGVKAALDGKTGISRGNNGWVEVTANGQVQIIGDQSVFIGISDMDGAQVTLNNIANLIRALEDPADTPESGGDRLITSGAVYTLEQTVNRLLTRVNNLEYKLAGIVIAGISLEGAYLGYNTLKYNNNDIIYDHTRNILCNVDPIFNAVKVGSRILLKYRWASESGEVRVFKTTVSSLSYGPNKIVLNDDIPDYSFAESNYKEITLSVVP